VDDLACVLALVKAGRDVTRLPAHQRLGPFCKELDQPLLVAWFNRKDIDQRHGVAVRADRDFHLTIPLLASEWRGRPTTDTACQPECTESSTRLPRFDSHRRSLPS